MVNTSKLETNPCDNITVSCFVIEDLSGVICVSCVLGYIKIIKILGGHSTRPETVNMKTIHISEMFKRPLVLDLNEIFLLKYSTKIPLFY